MHAHMGINSVPIQMAVRFNVPLIIWGEHGFMNMGGNLGGAISPTLTPYLAQYIGWEGALYATASLALFGALAWLWVHPEREIDLEEVVSSELSIAPTIGVETAE